MARDQTDDGAWLGIVFDGKSLRFMTADERTRHAEHRLPIQLVVIVAPQISSNEDVHERTSRGLSLPKE